MVTVHSQLRPSNPGQISRLKRTCLEVSGNGRLIAYLSCNARQKTTTTNRHQTEIKMFTILRCESPLLYWWASHTLRYLVIYSDHGRSQRSMVHPLNISLGHSEAPVSNIIYNSSHIRSYACSKITEFDIY